MRISALWGIAVPGCCNQAEGLDVRRGTEREAATWPTKSGRPGRQAWEEAARVPFWPLLLAAPCRISLGGLLRCALLIDAYAAGPGG